MAIVMKFGGSSVKNAERIQNVCKIIKSKLDKKPIVISSACGGITDMLIDAGNKAAKEENYKDIFKEIEEKHHEILKELDLKQDLVDSILDELKEILKKIEEKGANLEIMDTVQSFGEKMSTRIITAYLNQNGFKAKQFDAWDIGYITNDEWAQAELIGDAYEKIRNKLKDVKEVPIITGFVGKTGDGRITTNGRGGSDYTASQIGAALDVKEIQIWSDVDGVMTANPKVVPNAKSISGISFAEASELAFFGAKVLHPKTIIPAMDKNIPVIVLNTYNPEHPGTKIVRDKVESKEIVKSIAAKKGNIMININSSRMLNSHGFMARVFDIFSDYRKSVDMISTTEVNISLTIGDDEDLDTIIKDLEEIAEVKVMKDRAIVCVVGEGMYNIPGIAGKTFTALGKNKINIETISQGASEINISVVVKDEDADKAVQVLHKEYIG